MDRILSIIVRILTSVARLGIDRHDRWYPGRKIRILLAGYNGARNTGSDARVSAIASQVKQVFGPENVEITVMALDRENLAGYFDDDVKLFPFTTIFPLRLYRACSQNHATILCEGSTLKSTFANGLTLFLCEAAGVTTRQGKPCIAYGSEVGEMEPFIAGTAADLCRDTYFITRTKGSLQRLRDLGLRGHAGTDTAWDFDRVIGREKAGELLMQQGWDGEKPLFGAAVIDPFCWPVRASLFRWIKGLATGRLEGHYDKWYFFSDSPQRRKRYEAYIDGMAEAVRRHAEAHGYFPVIFGMERLDAKACRDLRDRLGMPGAVFLAGERSADEMTGLLRTLDLLVTSRYHAAVLSMESRIPIVAVSMDERLDGIMEELEMDGRFLHHVTDEGLGEAVLASLEAAERERQDIEDRIGRQTETYMKTLEEMGSFLREYITGRL